MQESLEELLRIARHAAQMAAVVHQNVERENLAVGAKSSSIDLVTEIDQKSEQQIVSILRAARPRDSIVGEEGASIAGSSGICWIIDPLDGTTNFVHGYPAHAVSIGVEIEGRRALGVVHDTFHNRVYEGICGEGARCDGKPVRVRAESELSRALIGTGFLPDTKVRRTQAEVLGFVLPLVRDVRRSGCPSLDICAVAAGVLDGFYECGLGRWDIAAGAAIAEAAGARVVELSSLILPNPLLIAGNAILVEKLAAILIRAGAATQYV